MQQGRRSPQLRGRVGEGAALPERLQEALAHLAGLQEKLGGVRQELVNGRHHQGEVQAERAQQLASAEEDAARRCANWSTEALQEDSLREQTRLAEERHNSIEEAMASELYWRWKEAFESHMRKGGRFDDFQIDRFLRECCGAVPSAGLEAWKARTALFHQEEATLGENLAAATDAESQLRLEMAAVAQQLGDLQSELKSHQVTNHAWWEDHLADGSRHNAFRAQRTQLAFEKEELERELYATHQAAAAAADEILRKQQNAASFRGQLLPAKERVAVLQETALNNEYHEEQVQKRIAVKRTELDRHSELEVWDVETQRLDQDGYKMQREALVILQRLAREREAARVDERRLQKVLGCLREKQREAVALNTAFQHTDRLLASTTKEVNGLRAAHAELRAERDRIGRQLKVARGEAAERANQLQTSSIMLQDSVDQVSTASSSAPRPQRGGRGHDHNRGDYGLVSAGYWSATPTGIDHTVPKPLPMSSNTLRGAGSQQSLSRRAL